MGKKSILMALTGLVFGFGSAVRSNAGTEVITDYKDSVPTYNYNYAPPPPRPIYYAPPPPVNVLIFPAYGYHGGRFCYHHRAYGRHVYARHW